MNRIPLNLISGSLGAGKTTLLTQLIKQKPEHEHWAFLVNEFGSIGIDGAILKSQGINQTYQIPGGCICCTALPELERALLDIAQQQKPDRIFIEPTGLAEPDTIVDILTSAKLKPIFDIQALVSVFDVTNTTIEDLKNMTIMQGLLNMADVIVFNKIDLATPQQISELESFCQQLYPPKQKIVTTQHGQIDLADLTSPHFSQQTYQLTLQQDFSLNAMPHLAVTDSRLPFQPTRLSGIKDRAYQGHRQHSIDWLGI